MRRAFVCFAVAAIFALPVSSSAAADAPGVSARFGAQAPGELLAYKVLGARNGGFVRTRRGAGLYIPPGALERSSLVTIVRLKGGRYDFHISGPWDGRVAVTMPSRRHRSIVLHRVGGTWVREGRRGQRTVWASQLSLFSWATDKIKAAACFKGGPREVIGCLVSKGLSTIDSHLVKWIADLAGVSNECAQALIASKGVVATLYTVILSSSCTAHAGETYHVPTPASPSPSPPSTSSPAPPSSPPPAPPSFYTEQQGSLGANTFQNPYNASGMGPKIPAYAVIQVTCKVYAPQIVSANPDGYWYRIHSSPWNDAYYAVANTFWNGDIPGQKPYTHNTDFGVRNC